MTVTIHRETGAAEESLVKTIGNFIQTNWDTYAPASLLAATINFKHNEDTSHNWKAKTGQQVIAFNLGDTIALRERQDSSIKKVGLSTEVYIDCFAITLLKAEQMARIINDILLDKRPTQTVTIKKSNASDDSKITKFEEVPLTFVPVVITDSLKQTSAQTAAVLTCEWEQHVT